MSEIKGTKLHIDGQYVLPGFEIYFDWIKAMVYLVSLVSRKTKSEHPRGSRPN